jgi:hypothetical protein
MRKNEALLFISLLVCLTSIQEMPFGLSTYIIVAVVTEADMPH